MLSFVHASFGYLTLPLLGVITTGVLGLLLACLVCLQNTHSSVKICLEMHTTHRVTPRWALSVFIIPWLKHGSGSRELLLLQLATLLSSMCSGEVATASPAFLSPSSSGSCLKELTSYSVRELSRPRLFSDLPNLLSSPVIAAPFVFAGSECCSACPVIKRWNMYIFTSPVSGPCPIQLRNSSLCGLSDVDGCISRFSSSESTPLPLDSFSQKSHRNRSSNAAASSARFACAHLPSQLLSLTQYNNVLHLVEKARDFTLRKTTLWPHARRTYDSPAAATAQQAREEEDGSEKDASSFLEDLKRLRILTGCSVVACKEALKSSSGDVHAAVDWLRRKGLSVTGQHAAARATNLPQRQQAEGVIAVASWRAGERGTAEGTHFTQKDKKTPTGIGRMHEGEVALKLSCSTDFVARNERVTQFARRAALLLAEHLKQVGLQGMWATATATTAHTEPQDGMPGHAACIQHQGEKQPSSESTSHPLQVFGETIVARGVPLVKTVLMLPWSSGEELKAGKDAKYTGALKKPLLKCGSFFQEQQEMRGASLRQNTSQRVSTSEGVKEKRTERDQVESGQRPTERAKKQHACEKTPSPTIYEELQYLSSIVKEPLSITEAVAIQAPVDSGIVASYLHGVIDKHVGTLAILAALAIDRGKTDGGAQAAQQSSRHAPQVAVGAAQGRKSSQRDLSDPQQLERAEETSQKSRKGSSARKSVAFGSQEEQGAQDALNNGTEAPIQVAASFAFTEQMRALAENICMQVAAAKPVALDEYSLDPELLKREEAIYRAQAEATGKPPATIERMVNGKVNKWLKNVLLLRQTWLLDDSGMTVQQKLAEFGAQQHMTKAPRVDTFVKIHIH